jgi:hydrogenase maturation protease
MKPILILGLGNPLQGDDGIGCRVAQELQQLVNARTPCPRGYARGQKLGVQGQTPALRGIKFLSSGAKQSPTRDSEIASADPSTALRSAQDALLAMTEWRNVEVMDGGTPGIGLLNFFEGRQRVIIIDAAEIGQASGSVIRFRPEDVALTGSAQRFSLHGSGVADALALARELQVALPEIVFFGVQPGRVDWSNELSPPVQTAIPRVIEAVLNELE